MIVQKMNVGDSIYKTQRDDILKTGRWLFLWPTPKAMQRRAAMTRCHNLSHTKRAYIEM